MKAQNVFAAEDSPEVLLGRTMLAQCLLWEAQYPEAQAEAELILESQKNNKSSKNNNNSVALFIQGEALYFQCQVGRERTVTIGHFYG